LSRSPCPSEGSIWRTDLWVMGQTYGGGTVTLTFCESGEDNTAAEGHIIRFGEPGNIVFIEDVVDHFLDVGDSSWVGAIHYTANVEVQVYARIYSISADGSASFGQLVEGIPTSDMTIPHSDPAFPGTREDQWVFAMRHTADDRFRVNIGVVNPTGVTARIGIGLFNSEGEYPAGDRYRFVTVPPFSMVQLSDPFADIDGGEWSTHVVRFETGTDGAGLFGYASVVDNATNDAFFVRGVKRYAPDE